MTIDADSTPSNCSDIVGAVEAVSHLVIYRYYPEEGGPTRAIMGVMGSSHQDAIARVRTYLPHLTHYPPTSISFHIPPQPESSYPEPPAWITISPDAWEYLIKAPPKMLGIVVKGEKLEEFRAAVVQRSLLSRYAFSALLYFLAPVGAFALISMARASYMGNGHREAERERHYK